MPKRPCADTTCGEHARPGSSRCDEHAREYERERSRRRREATKGVYKRKAWEIARHKVLARDFLCRRCGVRGSREVDHIRPLADFPDQHPYRLSGLQGLCSECHAEKSAEENARRWGGPLR